MCQRDILYNCYNDRNWLFRVMFCLDSRRDVGSYMVITSFRVMFCVDSRRDVGSYVVITTMAWVATISQ